MSPSYFDDGTLANDYQKTIEHRVLVDLVQNQSDWLYMVDELGKGRNPMLKEDAIAYIQETVTGEMNWLIADIIADIVEKLAAQDIDLSEGVAEWYNEYYGYEECDDEYIEGKVDPNGHRTF